MSPHTPSDSFPPSFEGPYTLSCCPACGIACYVAHAEFEGTDDPDLWPPHRCRGCDSREPFDRSGTILGRDPHA